MEGSLNGGVSSVDISKIPDHSFNSPIGFSFTNGAGGREVRLFPILICVLKLTCSGISVDPPIVFVIRMVSDHVQELQPIDL